MMRGSPRRSAGAASLFYVDPSFLYAAGETPKRLLNALEKECMVSYYKISAVSVTLLFSSPSRESEYCSFFSKQ